MGLLLGIDNPDSFFPRQQWPKLFAFPLKAAVLSLPMPRKALLF